MVKQALPLLVLMALCPVNPLCGDIQGELFQAVTDGNTHIISRLVGEGARLNERNGDGETPLITAILRNDHAMAETLVYNGADIDLPNAFNDTPLIAAIKTDSEIIIHFLLILQPEINIWNNIGESALQLALEREMLGVADLLIENGARITFAQIDNPLYRTVYNAKYRLFHLDGDLEAEGDDLTNAVLESNFRRCRRLLMSVENPRFLYDIDRALRIAAARNDSSFAGLLVQHGADPDSRNRNGYSALNYAVYHDRREVFDLLAPQSSVAERGYPLEQTPLFAALILGRPYYLEGLLDSGGYAGFRDGEGRTALMYAAYLGHNRIVNALIGHTPQESLGTVDLQNWNTLDYALDGSMRRRDPSDHYVIVRTLFALGIRPSANHAIEDSYMRSLLRG